MPIIALASTLQSLPRYEIYPEKEVGIEDQEKGIGNP
jgi:hypothetical protein